MRYEVKGRKTSTSHLGRNQIHSLDNCEVPCYGHARWHSGALLGSSRPGSAWLPDKGNSSYLTSLISYSINATGSQRGLSSQPCFIEVANPREQPYSGIKRPEAQHQPSVPRDVPTTEIGQRTKLSALDRPFAGLSFQIFRYITCMASTWIHSGCKHCKVMHDRNYAGFRWD